MNKPKVLLTGAGGFIGSNILNQLKNIFTFDLVDDFNNNDKLKFIDKRSYSKKYDINQVEIFLNNHYDIIIHMGAISDTTENDQEKLDYHNLNYSKRIWKYALQKNTTLIYASSAATYGDGSNSFNDCHSIVEKLIPLNKYGKSKNDFDKWVLGQKKYPLNWYGLKFFNVYGINEDNKGSMASVIHWGVPYIKKMNLLIYSSQIQKQLKMANKKETSYFVMIS